MESVTTAVSAFAHSGNPEDEMFVVDFNDDAVVEPMGGKLFTNDSQELGTAVTAVSASGRTALYDAVAQGLAHLQLARWKKKALVIISDGGDNASRYKYSQILELARQSQVALYSIGLLNDSGKEENPRVLRQLCSNTGGVAYFPGSQQAVITFSAQIAQDLREQYLLGFVPEKDLSGDSYHKIAVNVEDPHRGKMLVRHAFRLFCCAHEQWCREPKQVDQAALLLARGTHGNAFSCSASRRSLRSAVSTRISSTRM